MGKLQLRVWTEDGAVFKASSLGAARSAPTPESGVGLQKANLASVSIFIMAVLKKANVHFVIISDVSKPEDVQRIVDMIVSCWGTVHIACNNAGINMNSASEDTSLEEWDKTFNVNLRGLFLCCQVIPQLSEFVQNKSFSISESLLVPGIVDTPLIHSKDLQPLVQGWLSDIPAGRLAQATDLQAAVVYLASEASDYMTGHNLVIEGGQSLW
uniref:Uncharacterized protein n=1 Tax=Amazona collaria TaxID=241587 RepID=A0A8B9J3K9_9PSIT